MGYYYFARGARSFVRRRLMGGGIEQRILNTAPANLLTLWPLTETSGSVAYDISGNARHGTHSGPTLASISGPDGQPAPYFDGVNDYTNIYSTSLRDAFNGAEGSCIVWAKIPTAVWTDATKRVMLELRADDDNRVSLFKATTSNRLQAFYEAGNVLENVLLSSITTTDWFFLGLTWSATADEASLYSSIAATNTKTVLGTWVGNFGATTTIIGATNNTPSFPFKGYLSNVALWDVALTASQMAALLQAA